MGDEEEKVSFGVTCKRRVNSTVLPHSPLSEWQHGCTQSRIVRMAATRTTGPLAARRGAFTIQLSSVRWRGVFREGIFDFLTGDPTESNLLEMFCSGLCV